MLPLVKDGKYLLRVLFVTDETQGAFMTLIHNLVKIFSGSKWAHTGIYLFGGVFEAIFPEPTLSQEAKYITTPCKDVLHTYVTQEQLDAMEEEAKRIAEELPSPYEEAERDVESRATREAEDKVIRREILERAKQREIEKELAERKNIQEELPSAYEEQWKGPRNKTEGETNYAEWKKLMQEQAKLEKDKIDAEIQRKMNMFEEARAKELLNELPQPYEETAGRVRKINEEGMNKYDAWKERKEAENLAKERAKQAECSRNSKKEIK